MTVRRALAVLAVVFALPSCDDGGGRAVRVEMFEMGYRPSRIEVAAGETVTFVVENTGASTHELFVGDAEQQRAREDALAGGDLPPDPASLVVPFGETGELTHTFDGPGELEFACHIPGHHEAGMVGTIVVGA